MQFSDTTNKNGIIQDCEFLLSFNDAGISGNSTLLKQFTALANHAWDEAVDIILQSNVEWVFDDSNYTDFPIGATDLVDGQKDYKLPAASGSADISTFLRLIRVEVRDSSGQYRKIDLMASSPNTENGISSLYTVDGLPQYYRLIGDSVELYPSPATSSVTLTDGLKIHFQRSKPDFASTDTTKQPGFPSIYHRLISLKTSLDYAATRGMKQADYISNEYNKKLASLGIGIAKKNKDLHSRIQGRRTSYE